MAGELACGTSLYFVTMMFVAMLSIGVTYNLLGGLSSFSGIIFAGFALRTIVVSQFAKVLLLEAADKNLELPQLTITVYAVFYLSAMVGAFLYGRVRLRLPKVREPASEWETRVMYGICVWVGLLATFTYEGYTAAYGEGTEFILARSWALGLSYLLPFSLVLAVELRIRGTGGRHSFGWTAAVPWLGATFFAFFDTVRTGIILPSLIYGATCYLRGYRFRLRHYLVLGLGAVVFYVFVSPLEIYTREYTKLSTMRLQDRIYESIHTLNMEITHRADMESTVTDFFEETDPREQYFDRPGTYSLSRFSVIRADSTLISACSNGFHYGLAQINEVVSGVVPRFLNRNKAQVPETNYIANVSGLGADSAAQPIISAVADSYGAFGWLGVVLFPLLSFPAIFAVYESIFDFTRPWGTVALGICFLYFTEMNVARTATILFRQPLNYLVLSAALGLIVRLFPSRGDSFVGAVTMPGPSAS